MALILRICELGFYLVVAHAVADRGLQPERLSREKNRRINPEGAWFMNLAAHGLIHGGAVAIATGIWWLGIFETLAHMWIDDQRAQGEITVWQDQALYMGCKALWLVIVLVIEHV